MDLDAIILFYNVFSSNSFDERDLLLMSSAVKNNTVDINKSIYENMISLSCSNEVINHIDLDNENINIPLYELILKKSNLRHLLKISFQNQHLNDKSYLKIIEICLSSIGNIDFSSEVEILIFLIELISIRKIKDVYIFQMSKIIANFIYENDYLITKDNDKMCKNSKRCFHTRILLLKLFAYGLANFNYSLLLDHIDEPLRGYDKIIVPLIKSRSYGHLRLVFNSRVVTEENVGMIIDLIEDTFKEMYKENQNQENQEKDLSTINSLNDFFALIYPGKKIKMEFLENNMKLIKKVDL